MNERTVAVTFGPSRSPSFPRALAYAHQHLGTVEVSPGRHRAALVLTDDRSDRASYLHLYRLLRMAGSWATTEVEVAGEPEIAPVTQQMAWCAADWLRAKGLCAERYTDGRPWPRCYVCPLFNPDLDPFHPLTVPSDWE